ncbi:MAG: hypothetical protein Kow00109_04280 [Acidobacteriota bacterium]
MARARRQLFYKIGEVAKMCGVEPHVLRYWETVFPRLRPAKNRSGQRIYRPGDVELVQKIRHLLYDEGYTIAGANQRLQDEANGRRDPLPLFTESLQLQRRRILQEIAEELAALAELVRSE